MKKLLVGLVAGVLGLASVASADRGYSGRGDRHYPSGERSSNDRYARQRYEASIRYERGSRNHEATYVRYGQDNYNRRPDYDRDYVRRSDRGSYSVNGRIHRTNWGFSFGYGSNYGYAGDSVMLGFSYSNRPTVAYRYPGYSYTCAPDVYERRYVVAPVYERAYCEPDVIEYRAYRTPSGYYHRDSGSSYSYSTRSYYCR